jgi:hypothetical protein
MCASDSLHYRPPFPKGISSMSNLRSRDRRIRRQAEQFGLHTTKERGDGYTFSRAWITETETTHETFGPFTVDAAEAFLVEREERQQSFLALIELVGRELDRGEPVWRVRGAAHQLRAAGLLVSENAINALVSQLARNRGLH